MDEKEPLEAVETGKVEDEISEESYCTDSDYWDLKRFLELKNVMKRIFNNPERAKALRTFIANKEQVKTDIKKISEDENYAKGLGL